MQSSHFLNIYLVLQITITQAIIIVAITKIQVTGPVSGVFAEFIATSSRFPVHFFSVSSSFLFSTFVSSKTFFKSASVLKS